MRDKYYINLNDKEYFDALSSLVSKRNKLIQSGKSVSYTHLLGMEFDSFAGESFYNDKMQPVIEELKQKGLIKVSDGAQIVDLEEYNMPPCLITKKDGSSLYATRDIAAAMYRKKTYNFSKCIYVTGLEQKLHFAQWFKVIELMGYDWSKDLMHVPYGLVSLKGGKLSTRKGHVIYAEDIPVSYTHLQI